MIKIRIDLGTMKWLSSMDDHSVISRLNISSHAFQSFCYHCDTVGFFYLQLLCVPDNSSPLCKSCHYSDHRDFIDQCGDDLTLNSGSVKTACADQQVSGRLTLCTCIQQSNISPHSLAYTKHSVSGWINAYIFKKNLTSGSKKPCCDKVSSRRNISGNFNLASVQHRLRFNRSSCSLGSHICAEIIQHDLRMISGKYRLSNAGNPICIHTSQKHAGFYLCGSNR